MAETVPSMRSVLAVREFRALWLAEAQSVAGDQLARVALMFLVYDRTGSALWVAGVYALTFLPALAGGLGLSQLADRMPRRRLMATGQLVQAAAVGSMAIPGIPLVVVCGLVLVLHLVQGPVLAAQNALTREVFTDDDLYLRSQDLRGMTTNTMMLLGLGGGGALVAATGTSWALLLDALTYLLSAAVLTAWVLNRPAAGEPGQGWFDGARTVFGDRRLVLLLVLSWLVGLAMVPEGLVVPLADEMGAPDAATGWLLAADPLGFVLGTFVLSRFVPARARVRLIGVLATGSLAVLVVFALKPGLVVSLVLLALSGAFGAYQIAVMATFNTLVPNEVRGGAYGVARTGIRLSQGIAIALGGATAELTGPAAAIALAGTLGVVIAVTASIGWARLRVADEAFAS